MIPAARFAGGARYLLSETLNAPRPGHVTTSRASCEHYRTMTALWACYVPCVAVMQPVPGAYRPVGRDDEVLWRLTSLRFELQEPARSGGGWHP